MSPKDIDVVIVNYRTARLAVEAARSAYENGARSIVIVDNNSQDDSVSVLKKETEKFTAILSLPTNRGFSAGSNVGAAHGNRPVILFMNADVRLDMGALPLMAQAMERDQKIGAIAPALYYPDGRPQASAYFFITPIRIINLMLGANILAERLGWAFLAGNIDPHHNGSYSGEIASLYGCCMLIRRRAFEEVGGYDEHFFLYCEETDFCLRLRKKGWKRYRAAEAKAFHCHGESVKEFPLDAVVVMQKSLKLYIKKHFSDIDRIISCIACVVGVTARFLLAAKNHDRRRYWMALGVWLGWGER